MATLEHLRTGLPFVAPARVVIGRAPGAGLVLGDSGVSGEHASVFWNGDGWHIRDLGSRNGTWIGERRIEVGVEEPLALGDLVQFGVETQRWQVLDLAPPDDRATEPAPLAPTREVTRGTLVGQLALRLRVSADEEYVEIDIVGPDGPQRLAPRTFHDVFLVLARARLEQRGTGSAAEEGWLYFDDLCRMLGRERQRVNVEVFRARQQLAEMGIKDAVDAFERRPPTRQIRLGLSNVQVSSL